ncbi:endonuclease/exonuclease/phosphatase family protein [Oligoflexus tunisiensis]|uniref:endonuclease/exonuclease/phosphatase family protein n=1 Tax=Oligoflexus tunisiensis TaxID=708132 RepID=UPI001C403F8A|nr:endonuclease/exonuclease/phosphatase family protein [Oligoflexus tunisiensis]
MVLTYNAFLLGADDNSNASLKARLNHLPDALSRTAADIIFVQEVWSKGDRKSLVKAMRKRGYLAADMESRSWWPPYFLGNGLLILVRDGISIINEPQFKSFDEVIGNDRFANKGVLKVTVNVPRIGRIDLLTSQTSYLPFDLKRKDFDFTRQATMLGQIRQISSMVKAGSSPYKIFGGDINTHPYVWDAGSGQFDPSRLTPEYNELTQSLHMMDSFDLAKSHCAPSCFTWDNERNEQIKRSTKVSGGTDISGYAPSSRIDFILVAGADIKGLRSGTAIEETFEIAVDGKVETLHLSDHFGWLTELSFPAMDLAHGK